MRFRSIESEPGQHLALEVVLSPVGRWWIAEDLRSLVQRRARENPFSRLTGAILGAMDSRRHRSAIGARESAERAAHYLAGDPCVQLVYGFGSATQRDRTTVRDVDLAILTDPPLTLEHLTKRQADVISVTGAPIDLVSLNDASIVLAHEIVESGMCLYARTADAETEFVTRARARYWDFRPYRDEQWRLAGERLAERQHGS